jgi:hypothetical protein
MRIRKQRAIQVRRETGSRWAARIWQGRHYGYAFGETRDAAVDSLVDGLSSGKTLKRAPQGSQDIMHRGRRLPGCAYSRS